MNTFTKYYRLNKTFTLFSISTFVGAVLYETANGIYKFFPDFGAGFLYAGLIGIIFIGSYLTTINGESFKNTNMDDNDNLGEI